MLVFICGMRHLLSNEVFTCYLLAEVLWGGTLTCGVGTYLWDGVITCRVLSCRVGHLLIIITFIKCCKSRRNFHLELLKYMK